MRGRLGFIVASSLVALALTVQGASAAAMNVTMSPTSGPTGTTVTASSSDVCAAVPPATAPTTHDGPLILWAAVPAGSAAPADDSGQWDTILESDNTAEEGDAPWSGTFKMGEASGEFAKAPGAYTIYFSCGYEVNTPPPPGLPRTSGPPTAYGDKTARAFQVCQTGTATCAPTSTTSSTSTSTTTTTTVAATATTTTSTTTPAASGTAPSTRPGATVDVTATGYRPNSTGTIDFESTPVRVGTFSANAQGNVSVAVKIPANATAGVHHIVLTGVDPAGAPRVLRVQVNVVGGTIARAGAPSYLLLLLAFTLATTGLALRRITGDRRAQGAHIVRR